jgi:hypothetical protein
MQNRAETSFIILSRLVIAIAAGLVSAALTGCPQGSGQTDKPAATGSGQAGAQPSTAGAAGADAAGSTAAEDKPLPPSMPADKAQLPAEWPYKAITLPPDAKPGRLSQEALAKSMPKEISADGSTGHRVGSQNGTDLDGWRVAFESSEKPEVLYKTIEKALKPDGWRISNQNPEHSKAYYSQDGKSMFAVTYKTEGGPYKYEYQVMVSNPPMLAEIYKWAQPIP